MTAEATRTDSHDVIIEITGKPVAKLRGRVGQVNGRPIVFTPASTRKWERDARMVARQVMGQRKPLAGPLQIAVDIVFPVPASWPAWKREAALDGTVAHTTKPDADNVLKAAKDSCNGIVWLDDCQVVETVTRKRYGDVPAVRIRVRPAPGMLPAQVSTRPKAGAA